MKKLVMYMRLSKEDEYCRDESNSISNQRELIRKHVKSISELRKMDAVEIKDDGYSGKNMERPGMQELLSMVKEQKVGCIVVKDISRFSRDHLETGKYLEQIFPFMQVRFIAVNDGYDSNDYVGGIGEIDVAFKEILYDFYSEDLSQKVKTAMRARKERGKFMAAFAPYGYRKDPADRNRLIVDEEAAPVVQRIFREYLDGKSMYKIGQDLNLEQVATPSDHIEKICPNIRFGRRTAKRLWNSTIVARILGNETYTGCLVYAKSENLEVAARHSVLKPREEWKRLEGVHEAIVSQADYDAVQEQRKGCKTWTKVYETHCLSRKVVCANCGHRMIHSNAGKPKYECRQRYHNPNLAGCADSVRDEELEKIILTMLQEQMDTFADTAEIAELERRKQEERFRDAEKRLREMQDSFEKIEADLQEAYEAYRSGMTEKETYLQQKQMYEQMGQRLQENIRKQMKAVREIEDEDKPGIAGFDFSEGGMKLTALTKEIAEQFVDTVTVYKGGRIEVKWTFDR